MRRCIEETEGSSCDDADACLHAGELLISLPRSLILVLDGFGYFRIEEFFLFLCKVFDFGVFLDIGLDCKEWGIHGLGFDSTF